MLRKNRWVTLLSVFLLMAFVFLLFWHAPNPTAQERSRKLKTYLEDLGFTVVIEPMAQDRTAPIYKPSAWESWQLDGEELLVYFDESNRADYLAGQIDESFGVSARFGLRFVLVYAGEQEAILSMLQNLPQDDML